MRARSRRIRRQRRKWGKPCNSPKTPAGYPVLNSTLMRYCMLCYVDSPFPPYARLRWVPLEWAVHGEWNAQIGDWTYRCADGR